jgi:hypothetical protein
MVTRSTGEEREWLRTFGRFRRLLDQPDEHGWCESSTTFYAFGNVSDKVLLATAHTLCDDCSWDKKWDCSSFHAIMRDGTLRECCVGQGECLADALRRMTDLPERVVHEAFHGSGAGSDSTDGYIERTFVSLYRLDDEPGLRRRLMEIPPCTGGPRPAATLLYDLLAGCMPPAAPCGISASNSPCPAPTQHKRMPTSAIIVGIVVLHVLLILWLLGPWGSGI